MQEGGALAKIGKVIYQLLPLRKDEQMLLCQGRQRGGIKAALRADLQGGAQGGEQVHVAFQHQSLLYVSQRAVIVDLAVDILVNDKADVGHGAPQLLCDGVEILFQQNRGIQIIIILYTHISTSGRKDRPAFWQGEWGPARRRSC